MGAGTSQLIIFECTAIHKFCIIFQLRIRERKEKRQKCRKIDIGNKNTLYFSHSPLLFFSLRDSHSTKRDMRQFIGHTAATQAMPCRNIDSLWSPSLAAHRQHMQYSDMQENRRKETKKKKNNHIKNEYRIKSNQRTIKKYTKKKNINMLQIAISASPHTKYIYSVFRYYTLV